LEEYAVTVILRHNQALELNRVEYHGAVTLVELVALADFQAEKPNWLSHDCLNLIMPGADFKNVDFAALDEIFKKYRTLFEPLHFVIVRRSAWICQSPAARPHLHHWIGDRDTREGMSSDLREFNNFAEAGEWLVLTPDQAGMLQRGEDFDEVATFSIPVEPMRAAAR
jgi:hypothetical protein